MYKKSTKFQQNKDFPKQGINKTLLHNQKQNVYQNQAHIPMRMHPRRRASLQATQPRLQTGVLHLLSYTL